MQIILETRFHFPHCVMTNVSCPKVIAMLKLIYLFWFETEQTLDLALLASVSSLWKTGNGKWENEMSPLCYLAETMSSIQYTFNAS